MTGMLLTSTTEATIDENALNQFLSYFKNGNYLGAVLTFIFYARGKWKTKGLK